MGSLWIGKYLNIYYQYLSMLQEIACTEDSSFPKVIFNRMGNNSKENWTQLFLCVLELHIMVIWATFSFWDLLKCSRLKVYVNPCILIYIQNRKSDWIGKCSSSSFFKRQKCSTNQHKIVNLLENFSIYSPPSAISEKISTVLFTWFWCKKQKKCCLWKSQK